MSGLRQNTLEKTNLLEQIRKVLSVVNKKRGEAPDEMNCCRELRLVAVGLRRELLDFSPGRRLPQGAMHFPLMIDEVTRALVVACEVVPYGGIDCLSRPD